MLWLLLYALLSLPNVMIASWSWSICSKFFKGVDKEVIEVIIELGIEDISLTIIILHTRLHDVIAVIVSCTILLFSCFSFSCFSFSSFGVTRFLRIRLHHFDFSSFTVCIIFHLLDFFLFICVHFLICISIFLQSLGSFLLSCQFFFVPLKVYYTFLYLFLGVFLYNSYFSIILLIFFVSIAFFETLVIFFIFYSLEHIQVIEHGLYV